MVSFQQNIHLTFVVAKLRKASPQTTIFWSNCRSHQIRMHSLLTAALLSNTLTARLEQAGVGRTSAGEAAAVQCPPWT